jgi:hypothetical protein
MADNSTMRSCRKTACRWPAAASLSYRYDTRQVWLLDLVAEPDPSLYDLCPPHADALVVPKGWARVDQRTYTEPVAEPAGRDLIWEPAPAPEPVAVGAAQGASRYEALSRDLPRLARELADHERGAEARDEHGAVEGPPRPGDQQVCEDPGSHGEHADPSAAGAAVRPAGAPVPSRDLAPLAADAVGRGADARPGIVQPSADGSSPDDSDGTPAEQVPGQLAIPVPEAEEDIGEAVVVSIELAGSRRRGPRE